MLSYRHAFHAGNAADVLKHTALVFCLEYLREKEKPLLCVDTHAGAGRYVLGEGFAAQNREWEAGIGRLLAIAGESGAEKLPATLRRYLQLCAHGATAAGSAPSVYPGSPEIMARLLRPGDRLVCFELHPSDYTACAQTLADSATGKRAEVRREDGLAGLKSLLPPPGRRGLVLIDPSYELKEEYERVIETAGQALRRFPTGTYLIWYPLLRDSPAADFPQRLTALHQGNHCRVELYTASGSRAAANAPRRMYGSGLAIYNPPWTLHAALAESLPLMSEAVGSGSDGWTIETA